MKPSLAKINKETNKLNKQANRLNKSKTKQNTKQQLKETKTEHNTQLTYKQIDYKLMVGLLIFSYILLIDLSIMIVTGSQLKKGDFLSKILSWILWLSVPWYPRLLG